MIIVDDVRQVIDQVKAIADPAARSQAVSWGITMAIVSGIYYICVTTVVIVLGRRLINATQKAWRESRRDPS